ncbi:hypothetical protein DBA29_17340 [Xenophilus aerolatus]|nr:hypothetical protein [Xenophilus aerolatus]
MLCKVYFANSKGLSRPKDEVRKSPRIGELRLRLMSRYGAVVSHPETGRYLLPAMDAVTITIKARGVLLEGTELIPRRAGRKAAYDMYAQIWWCVPVFDSVVLDDLSVGDV